MSNEIYTVDVDNDGIALVTWDMTGRSMNVFTQAALEQLDGLVDRFVADDAVKGVVFTSGKSSFSGGADLTMMKTMLAGMAEEKRANPDNAQQLLFDQVGKMSQLFRKIETCGKPWVSAINGVCMGGAFELSLACHGRVVADSPTVKMALPEVKVGIFPGAGGTQRVPRLTNAQDALQMMTTGQSLTPSRAKAMGLVHEVVEPKKLITAAKAMIKGGLSPVAPWDVKGFKLPGGQIWSAQGAQLWPAASAILRRETQNNYPAAKAILQSVFEGLQVPFDTGLRIEQRYFSHILQTTEAQSMIRSLFVSMQEINKGARRPAGIKPTKFRKIGVVGAGFMGAGIAYVTAKAGIPVVLIDRDLEAAAKGKAYSEDLVKKGLQKGKTTKEEGEKLLSLISTSTDHADLADADLVIEAVFEDRDVKKAVTESIEAQIRPTTVYASNTSTLPITGLAKNSKRPKNFIGIHFFSPVDKMMLVEIILGRKTSDKALAVALDYVAAIKKTPIVVNDTRGFFVNRCVLRYMNVQELKNRFLAVIALEAARTVEEGIVTDPREADLGTILGFGFAPYTGGALSYIDSMGAKAFVDMCAGLARKYGRQFRAPKLLIDMAEKGETFYGRFNPYGEDKAAA